jgi:hypothetical protein
MSVTVLGRLAPGEDLSSIPKLFVAPAEAEGRVGTWVLITCTADNPGNTSSGNTGAGNAGNTGAG